MMSEVDRIMFPGFTAADIQQALEEYFDRDDAEFDSFYEIKYGSGGHVPGLGEVKYVDDYGGEGQGDDYWVVFSVTGHDVTRHFRMEGWYQSYAGGEFDGDLKEVTPKEKVVTVWE